MRIVAKVLKKKRFSWRNILSIALFFVAFYLLITPFVPQLGLLWNKATDKTDGYVYANNHPNAPEYVKKATTENNNLLKPIPSENRLVIPGINVDIAIVEGNNESVLLKGGWRIPDTSTPEKGGNTVIAAHRFLYTSTNASYFYNLDKLKVGDPVVIFWQGKEYNYTIASSKEVAATDVHIEDNTKTPLLTLYTCAPLWSGVNRLVVTAKPV